jgi:hypothetical protein
MILPLQISYLIGSDRQGLAFSSLILNYNPLCLFLLRLRSVFVAEAAALAFATSLLHFMQLNPVNFLTDNQLLSHYINSTGHFDTPDWRAASYTQIITSCLTGASKVFNISRNHNHMADSLAKQGLVLLHSNSLRTNYTCTNPSHAHGCPLLRHFSL